MMIAFQPARAEDFERLVELRLRVMREHLERVGRFDPVRARERFRSGFVPQEMRLIEVDGAFAGCVTLKPDAQGLELMHFYVAPDIQNRGVGGSVLRLLCAEADALGQPIHLGVLKGSPAVRFYERHGFRPTHEDAWDFFLRRAVLG